MSAIPPSAADRRVVAVRPRLLAAAVVLAGVAGACAPAEDRVRLRGADPRGAVGLLAGAVPPGPSAPLPATPAPTPTLAAAPVPSGGSTAPVALPATDRNSWFVDPATSGEPFPGASVAGLLTFRGSPTRSFTGAGPVPSPPVLRWAVPATGGFCRESTEGSETSVWCGTGWTGQPAIWRWGDRWAVAFGAYDGAVHVLDATTGSPLLDPFPTGDLIKGSVSIDPQGYPLLYVGSRDNFLRVVALDRNPPVELWRLAADDVSPTMWNDDWDGSPLVLGDLLLEGGENGQFHVVKLNRRIGPDGKVTVAPRLLFNTPAWDEQLLADTGSPNVSIESSVAVAGHIAYTANSGGLIEGWDLDAIAAGVRGDAVRTFRFWMGDDTDASIVVDTEGYLYATAEYERSRPRADEVGQLAKLDPSRPDAPLVWSVPLRSGGVPSGAWATPALWGPLVIVATNAGELIAYDRADGQQRWLIQLVGPTWGSPVVVDDVLIQGDCAGVLHGFALDPADPAAAPAASWSIELGGCIESTPAVFGGHIVVGTRSGRVFGLAGG